MEERERSRNDRLIHGYLSAFSSGDPKQVSAHVTDAFVNQHFGVLGAGCETKRVYEKRLQKFLNAFAELRYDVDAVCSDEHQGTARYTMNFKQNDVDFVVPGMMWFEIEDGLISKRIDCWDGLSYLKQANADAEAIAALL